MSNIKKGNWLGERGIGFITYEDVDIFHGILLSEAGKQERDDNGEVSTSECLLRVVDGL